MEAFRNETITIDAASEKIADDWSSLNAKRTSIIITNTGATNITISIDSEAVAGAGIIIYPGGSWERTATIGFLPPQKRINAISSGAGGTISLYEEVLQ